MQGDRHDLEVDPAERPADDPDVVGGYREHILQGGHVERAVGDRARHVHLRPGGTGPVQHEAGGGAPVPVVAAIADRPDVIR